MSEISRSETDFGAAARKANVRNDTSEACRERASADLLQSVAMLTTNQRLILERSAASWSSRADLLERLETSARERLGRSSAEPESMRQLSSEELRS